MGWSRQEGENIGTFRLYQIGEPVSNLNVKIKCEGEASEGLDYRSLDLGNIQKINKYKEIHIRPISDGLKEGTEKVTIRILESDDYEIADEYSMASFDILDEAYPDIEFQFPASVNEEAKESAEVKIVPPGISEEEIVLTYSVQGVLAEVGEDNLSSLLSQRPY